MSARQMRFGEWVFEPGSCSLRRGEERALLEPRVADLLEFFITHQNEVHTHDRLVTDVWHGQVVSDEAVRRAVSVLRRVANGAVSPCIRTIYKRGYIANFPEPADRAIRRQSADGLIRECDASLTQGPSTDSPGLHRTRKALECLRSAVELDPRLLEILSHSGMPPHPR